MKKNMSFVEFIGAYIVLTVVFSISYCIAIKHFFPLRNFSSIYLSLGMWFFGTYSLIIFNTECAPIFLLSVTMSPLIINEGIYILNRCGNLYKGCLVLIFSYFLITILFENIAFYRNGLSTHNKKTYRLRISKSFIKFFMISFLIVSFGRGMLLYRYKTAEKEGENINERMIVTDKYEIDPDLSLDDETYMEIACKVDSEDKWQACSEIEKDQLICLFAKTLSDKLGMRESLPELFIADLPANVLGIYNSENDKIEISKKVYEEYQGYELIRVLAHEIYHRYERRIVEIYLLVKDKDKYKNLLFFDKATTYAWETENYIDAEKGDFTTYLQYSSQLVEEDANAFANDMVFDFKEKLHDYIQSKNIEVSTENLK